MRRNRMKISHMFQTKYATGDDLKGKEYTFTISRVKPELMHPSGNPVQKFVLYFAETQRGVILSRTLADQIATITGQDDTETWTSKKITIYPEPMVVAGKKRIGIRAKAPTNGVSQPPPEFQEEDEF
jgi:hypothetical protein